jgi:hypothetical protein
MTGLRLLALDLKWNRKNGSSLGVFYDHVRTGTVVVCVRLKFSNDAFSVAMRTGIAREERAMWIIKLAFGKSDDEKVQRQFQPPGSDPFGLAPVQKCSKQRDWMLVCW